MGKSHSKSDDADFFDINDWEQISQNQIQTNNRFGFDQPVTFRHRISGELVDAYYLSFISQKQYEQFKRNLQFRRNQPNIVRALYYNPNVQKEFCSTNYGMTVFIEHVRGRLSEYKDIPLRDSLYCMIAMLDGYKKLYSEKGRFYISQDQIIIDDQGEVRVWMNSDLSKDIPEESDSKWNKWQGSEYEMVEDIIGIILQNTDESEGPRVKFSDFYEREKLKYENQVGFEQAKRIIFDYSKASDMDIPRVFESVLEIYQQNGDVQMLNSNQFALIGNSQVRNYQDMQHNQRQQGFISPQYLHQNPRSVPSNYHGSDEVAGYNSHFINNYSGPIHRNFQQTRQPQTRSINYHQIAPLAPSTINAHPRIMPNFSMRENTIRGANENIVRNTNFPGQPIRINAPQMHQNQNRILYHHHSAPPVQSNQVLVNRNLTNQPQNWQVNQNVSGPIKIRINGQSIHAPPAQVQHSQHYQRPMQIVRKQWVQNRPQIKEQVNEIEVIKELDKYHQEASLSDNEDQYPDNNQIINEAMKQEIERQINDEESENEREYVERQGFYQKQGKQYSEDYYKNINKNEEESNGSKENIVYSLKKQGEKTQFNNLSGQNSHNNSIYNNSVQNNSIHNNSIHNNSSHLNGNQYQVYSNQGYGQNSSQVYGQNQFEQQTVFRQISSQNTNAYTWANNSVPPLPNKLGNVQQKILGSNRSNSRNEKQIYYTLNNEIELDPEIAADLAMFA